MHPSEIFDLNIKRVTALIGTHKKLHGKTGKPATVVSDVMRAAVVMAVSGIDAYLHGILKLYVARAASLQPPPERLLVLIKEWKLDSKTVLSYMLHAKGPSDLTTAVEGHFADRTLQDPSKVADVFDMLGIPNIWVSVAETLGRSEQDVKSEFAEIVRRRHRIAHEADLDPDGKTPNKKRALPRSTAEKYRESIAKVVNAMNGVLVAKFP